MARTFTQGEAVSYLRTNANWLWLQMQRERPTDPGSLRPKTVIRYAGNFYKANEQDKREFATLAEARGHGAGEHHRGRAQKRAQGYERPTKIPRGRFNQPIHESDSAHGAWRPSGRGPRVHAGYVRITSGEGMAKRELVLAANKKQTVYINVTGPGGRYQAMFSRAGYRADLLLEAAGYKRSARSPLVWVKARPDASLEAYLLRIWATIIAQKYAGAEVPGRITLYEILVDEEAVPVRQRRKREPWPERKPGWTAGLAVQSLPTASVRKKRLNTAHAPNVRGKRPATK